MASIWRSRGVWLAVAAGVAALGVLGCGRGGEWQFSPDSFQHRGVTHFSLPFTGVRVLTLAGGPRRLKIAEFWLEQGYLPAAPGKPARWDAVTGFSPWQRLPQGGPAKGFWHRAGCKTDEMADGWIGWSRRNPALAARLWPEEAGLLARGGWRYDLAGRLMAAMERVEGEAEFGRAWAGWREEFEAAPGVRR